MSDSVKPKYAQASSAAAPIIRHSPRSAAVSSIYKRPHSETLTPPSSPKQARSAEETRKIRLDLLTRKLKLQRKLKQRNIAHVSEQYFLQYFNGNVVDHEIFVGNNKTNIDSHVALHSIAQQADDFEALIFKQLCGRRKPAASAGESSPSNKTVKKAVKSEIKENSTPNAQPATVPVPQDSNSSSPSRSKSPRSSTGNFTAPKSPTPASTPKPPAPRSPGRLRSPAEGSIERAAKQEAHVLSRIAELRKQGLWSQKQLPRCADPIRAKTHWDYLLEEMHWMAIDFSQERKWKTAAARKLARDIARIDREQKEKEQRIEKEKERDLKRIASAVAKEIRAFWKGVEKVVDYKANMIVEAKKQKALDRHLDYIVGQTEKFSSLVKEGLTGQGTPTPSTGSKTPSVTSKEDLDDKDDYLEESEEEDDERTIDKELSINDRFQLSNELY